MITDESERELADRALRTLLQERASASADMAIIKGLANDVRVTQGPTYSSEGTIIANARAEAWLAISKLEVAIENDSSSRDLETFWAQAMDATNVWLRDVEKT